MEHLPSLISDLAVILILAGVITIVFKRLGQPVILGYILAGFFTGPSLDLIHLTDTENIRTWADIGVIFLLFSIGLEFSFKKLFKMGATVFITAITVIIGMMTVGYLTGLMLGWSSITSLFLGGMMAMSSTTIIIKTYEDLGVKNQLFASNVIGVLIIEDLFAVILMVLLATIAVGGTVSGGDIAFRILRLFIFLLIWFAAGIFILPTLLNKARKWLSDETLTIISVALCFSMVLLATSSGFSSALGAFVMGSLLAETIYSERMEKLMHPLKDLFGAVFFVSVGMMINPNALFTNILPIIIISIAVMAGQIFFGTVGMIFGGQTLKVAMQSGFSLAQVGEFAFIIASLGESLGVTDSAMYPTIVAVSAITTFFTPTLIRRALPAYEYFTARAPKRLIQTISRLSFAPQIGVETNEKKELFKEIISILILHLSIIAFIIVLGLHYVVPFVSSFFVNELPGRLISAIIIIGVMSPFLRAIMIKKNKTIRKELKKKDHVINKAPLVGIIVIRTFICGALVIFVLSNIFHIGWILLGIVAIGIIFFLWFSKPIKKQSIAMEQRFLNNLNEKEVWKDKQRSIKKNVVESLLDLNVHLAELEIDPESENVGKQLKNTQIRQTYGVNIVSIKRGEKLINIPNGDEYIFPFDKITVVGSDEQIERLNKTLASKPPKEETTKESVTLKQFTLTENSSIIGKTIRNTTLREKYNCMIVGIERENESLVNPDINENFKEKDILWVVGEPKNLITLAQDLR